MVLSFFHHFGWIKKRRIRAAVKNEILSLQRRIISLHEKYLATNDAVEKEAITLEREGIVKQIEDHFNFLAITKKID